MADELLFGSLKKGGSVIVDQQGDGLHLEFRPPERKQIAMKKPETVA